MSGRGRRSGQALTRGLLRCGLAAGPVFVTAFLAEGAVREGYSPLRHPVSALALGPRGWVQTANFTLAGALFLAGAAGLARSSSSAGGGEPADGPRSGPVLIGAAGAGLICPAVFPTDPVSGYPPGSPASLPRPTVAGQLHNLAAVPVLLGLPVADWRSLRAGRHGFGLYCAGTAVTMLAAEALAGAGFAQPPRLVSLGGLLQRTGIIAGFGWLSSLSGRSLRRAAG